MAQEAERLSSRANLLGLLLEVETERAEKYRNILLQLAGGGGDNATGVSRFPGGASICLAPLKQVMATPSAEQGGVVDRNNEPASETEGSATVAAQSSAVPSTSSTGNDRLATSAGGSSGASQLRLGVPTTAGGRRSVSHGRSARSSKRKLLHSSSNVLRPTPVNGPMRPRRTGGQSSQQRTFPTPSPFILTGTGELGSFISAVDVVTRASLGPLRLTRAEVIRSEETSGISWGDFSRVFGCGLRAEWVECPRFPGYKTFLCADYKAQPYLPTGTGKPGLILRPPTVGCMHENDNVALQVLSCSPQDNLLYYQGQYTRDHLRQIRVNFCDLPAACREVWIVRICGGRNHAAVRARIKLRNEFNREPSVVKIQEYLLQHPIAPTTRKEVSAALRAGEEKMLCDGIYCTTYDSNLATIIQKSGTANDNQ